MISFVCWKWQSTGWRAPYHVRHVNALYRMLCAHMQSPFTLTCITDKVDEKGYDKGITLFKLWKDNKLKVSTGTKPNCFIRLKLFDEDCPLPENGVVSIDLDCIVLADLTPLFTDDWFKIVKGRYCPYNGSMWQLRSNERPDVYKDFNPLNATKIIAAQRNENGNYYYGSDQGWLSYKIKDAPVWTEADGVLQIGSSAPIDMRSSRIAFFPGGLKPWSKEMRLRNPAIYNLYAQYV